MFSSGYAIATGDSIHGALRAQAEKAKPKLATQNEAAYVISCRSACPKAFGVKASVYREFIFS
jgi:hypothetical protein